MNGIDGSFDLQSDRGTVRLQANKLYARRISVDRMDSMDSIGSDEEVTGDTGEVSTGTGSVARAPEGHIIATLDPEVP